MINLIDGPCKGTFACKRAPLFLRVVMDKNGEMDILDQVEDTPKQTETVYIYQRQGKAGAVHIYGQKIRGWYALGEYHYLPEVDGQALRDNAVWQAWATAHMPKGEG